MIDIPSLMVVFSASPRKEFLIFEHHPSSASFFSRRKKQFLNFSYSVEYSLLVKTRQIIDGYLKNMPHFKKVPFLYRHIDESIE